jgi:hypothetical protein
MLNNTAHFSSIAVYVWYALPPSILILSLIVYISAQWRFVHFHGQKTSRQDRYKSIYKDASRKRTKPFRILSAILFFTPDVHLRELKKVWTDDLIVEEVWRKFMEKLVCEWIEFVLYVSCAPLFLRLKRSFILTPTN